MKISFSNYFFSGLQKIADHLLANKSISTGKTLLEFTIEELLSKLQVLKKLQLEASAQGNYNQAILYYKEVESLENELALLQAAFPRAKEIISNQSLQVTGTEEVSPAKYLTLSTFRGSFIGNNVQQ